MGVCTRAWNGGGDGVRGVEAAARDDVGAGPFEVIAPTLAEMHEAIVAAADAGEGDAWLDVASGTGELACDRVPR